MGTFSAEQPARLRLSATEEADRRNAIAATGSPSPTPFAPIGSPPAIYSHIGHDAQYGTGRRNGRTIRLLILHTTEGGTLVNDMSYAARRPELVSSSAYVGELGELGYGVPEADRPYTTGRWNDESLAAEIVGYAAWTEAQWRARPLQLEGITRLLVDWCRRHSIPPRWLTAEQITEGASKQSATPVAGVNAGICDHLEANLAARLLGASTSSTTHSDVGPALRRIVITELIPEASRRLAGATTTDPQEDDEMPGQIRVKGDAATYNVDGIFATWTRNETVQAAAVAGGLVSPGVKTVARAALGVLELRGAEPDYTGVDLAAFPEKTSAADFARHER